MSEKDRFDQWRKSNPDCLLWNSYDAAYSAWCASRQRYVEGLEQVREVWAGSECGLPVTAQEAYAIRLCKQMYEIACEALGTQPTPLGDDQSDW